MTALGLPAGPCSPLMVDVLDCMHGPAHIRIRHSWLSTLSHVVSERRGTTELRNLETLSPSPLLLIDTTGTFPPVLAAVQPAPSCTPGAVRNAAEGLWSKQDRTTVDESACGPGFLWPIPSSSFLEGSLAYGNVCLGSDATPRPHIPDTLQPHAFTTTNFDFIAWAAFLSQVSPFAAGCVFRHHSGCSSVV
ncbi:hypothetical protein Micbo1qcDRAFT_170202 [Microdochium bolleyi]|uniref:Uncharacterized protein n=1 Tax=Microdochium bolleyi TaxID=196109 RepID=A0A136JGS9_9PEZI|nr:hypothetical protein Micbo1qcDRAFT_170202 [Microdochium bolleyi]